MKRYIKSMVENCPTFREWIFSYGHPHDVINLDVDGKRLVVINHEEGLPCRSWKYFLRNPNACPALYRLGDYLVVDGTGSRVPLDDVYQYVLSVAPQYDISDK